MVYCSVCHGEVIPAGRGKPRGSGGGQRGLTAPPGLEEQAPEGAGIG